MKKKIAFIIKGGVGVGFKLEGCVWLVELCEYMAKEYDLTVFSFVKVDDQYQPKGYKIVSAPSNSSGSTIWQLSYLMLQFIKLHRLKRFDLIHGFWAYPSGLMSLMTSKLFNIKSILTFIGSETANIPDIQYGLYRNRYKKQLIQFIAAHVDCIVAQTQNHAKRIKENTRYKRLEIISFGIDNGKFPVAEKILSNPYQFLYLGDINRVKDLPTLLRTFKLISSRIEAKLDIVGLDTLKGEIQELVNESGLSDTVNFYGRQLNNELTPFLQKAHFLLLTSLSEAHALVANEAMASGVVVCGTRVGILDDLSGEITTVVDVGNAEGLANKVFQLIENPQKYQELRDKGIQWSQEHGLESQCEKYSQLYMELLN
ncbi:glycosyltransferase family 4 protein [Spirosoma gilvum]